MQECPENGGFLDCLGSLAFSLPTDMNCVKIAVKFSMSRYCP